MILVFIMLGGVVVGFFTGACVYGCMHSENKSLPIYIKLMICIAVIIAGLIYCLKNDWYYAFCLLLGVAVGMSPYLTSKTKNSEENTEDKGDE
jgi:predicted MFS family arabinose efflux permease